jgi:hypothetical protein
MSLSSRFNPGGLFRCCVQTIIDDDGPEPIGRCMNCRYCDAPMVVIDEYGYPEWAWDRDAEVSLDCIKSSKLGAALNPREALFRLLDEAIDGAQCAHCGRRTGFVAGTEDMPLSEHICWYIFDPETNTYMRGCEASDA